MTIYFCGKRTIHKLNFQYRKIDRPTDVLAFSYNEIKDQNSINYLGDVVIAIPIAIQQARENHHGLKDEINLLVVHGILHLCGFDHESPKDRQLMWKKQEEILRNL
jgi:probable rRNA maturation factor